MHYGKDLISSLTANYLISHTNMRKFLQQPFCLFVFTVYFPYMSLFKEKTILRDAEYFKNSLELFTTILTHCLNGSKWNKIFRSFLNLYHISDLYITSGLPHKVKTYTCAFQITCALLSFTLENSWKNYQTINALQYLKAVSTLWNICLHNL